MGDPPCFGGGGLVYILYLTYASNKMVEMKQYSDSYVPFLQPTWRGDGSLYSGGYVVFRQGVTGIGGVRVKSFEYPPPMDSKRTLPWLISCSSWSVYRGCYRRLGQQVITVVSIVSLTEIVIMAVNLDLKHMAQSSSRHFVEEAV